MVLQRKSGGKRLDEVFLGGRRRETFWLAATSEQCRVRLASAGQETLPQRRQAMKKWVWVSACVTAMAGAAALVSVAGLKARAVAKDEEPARAAQLPIGQVVLFSSGVGYFQREGSVEGDSRVDLSFPVA